MASISHPAHPLLPGIEPPPSAPARTVAERESCAAMWQRVLEQALREGAGLAPDAAGQLAARQLERLRALIGGEAIYMPRPSLAPRNAAIRQQFTGGAEGLARVAWAQLSRSSVYRISGG